MLLLLLLTRQYMHLWQKPCTKLEIYTPNSRIEMYTYYDCFYYYYYYHYY